MHSPSHDMYLVIHTMTISQVDCVMQAQFFHTVCAAEQMRQPVQLIAKRVRVKYYPGLIKSSQCDVLKPNLRSIVKKKLSHVKHHIKTIKIGSPIHGNEFPQKVERCITPPISSQSALQQCSAIPNLVVEKPLAEITESNLNCDSTVQQTAQWLTCNRFSAFLQTFAGFSGADMLRMSKEDLVQICGQADGIRLYNSLHLKCISPKLTMYVCRENTAAFNAIYLMSYNSLELTQKLSAVIGIVREQVRNVYFQGPHGIHVNMSNEVVQNIKEDSMFLVDLVPDNSNGYVIILKPIIK